MPVGRVMGIQVFVGSKCKVHMWPRQKYFLHKEIWPKNKDSESGLDNTSSPLLKHLPVIHLLSVLGYII